MNLPVSPSDLRDFVLVVQHGGFSAAERATGVDKSRLSRKITRLEQILGVQLLRRTPRHVTLTTAGERVYAHCREGLLCFERAIEELNELAAEPSGRVRLSCPVQITQTYLTRLLPAFLQAHPRIQVEVEASDRMVDLSRDPIDLALRVRKELEDSRHLVARPLLPVRNWLVASPALIGEQGAIEDPKALANWPSVAWPSTVSEAGPMWALRRHEQIEHFSHQPRLLVNNLDVQLRAVETGIGIGLLPNVIVSNAIKAGRLARVLPDWEGECEELIHLIFPRSRHPTPATRELISYLCAHLPDQIKAGVQPPGQAG